MAAYEVPPSPDYIPGPEVLPLPDYIPGPEEPQSPPPLDFVPEPMYPEYNTLCFQVIDDIDKSAMYLLYCTCLL
ncbi:hypothetical protein Tco_0207317 [Tanacetum coccineum]